MSRNYYGEINLHLVWRTKDSAPLLTPFVMPAAFKELRARHENIGSDCEGDAPEFLLSKDP